GMLIYVNNRWCKVTGCVQNEALSEGWKRAIHPDEREQVAAKWYQCVRHGKPFDLEFCFQKPDGGIVWVPGQALPEMNEKSEIVGYVGTITDVTEYKKEEEELEKRLKELERFYRVTADREKRIIELKQQVKKLKEELEKGASPQTEG
ncbi:MAG: PAS domain-containing protein, partial [Candidatus Omnitrophica bacterium]|nr:PAS domain-containing protein [Candidatus Omnitrophota bacterium]